MTKSDIVVGYSSPDRDELLGWAFRFRGDGGTGTTIDAESGRLRQAGGYTIDELMMIARIFPPGTRITLP